MSTKAPPSISLPPRPDLSSFLAKQILQLIRTGDLQPGDRLPAAKALAERFAVAMPTLREALRRLQTTGEIEIRHGSGIYVRHAQERFVMANPHHAGLKRAAILQLLDARLLIEPYLAEHAAWHATDEDIVVLEHLLDRAGHFLVDHDEQLHRVSMLFHATVARMSGNLVLHHVIESLIELYSSEQLTIQWLYDARARDHQQHRAIFAAIRDHLPELARDRMAMHLRDVKTTVEASLATTVSSRSGTSSAGMIGDGDERRRDGAVRSPA